LLIRNWGGREDSQPKRVMRREKRKSIDGKALLTGEGESKHLILTYWGKTKSVESKEGLTHLQSLKGGGKGGQFQIAWNGRKGGKGIWGKVYANYGFTFKKVNT